MALDGYGFFSFMADGLKCGLQIFAPDRKPSHPLATYDAVAFGELSKPVTSLMESWNGIPMGLVEALSFAVGSNVTAPWFEVRGKNLTGN